MNPKSNARQRPVTSGPRCRDLRGNTGADRCLLTRGDQPALATSFCFHYQHPSKFANLSKCDRCFPVLNRPILWMIHLFAFWWQRIKIHRLGIIQTAYHQLQRGATLRPLERVGGCRGYRKDGAEFVEQLRVCSCGLIGNRKRQLQIR